jgi:glutathione synthase/RimK-type ligase-like ATP-grasp enzyme
VVALVTAEVLPVPDSETGLVRDALAEVSVAADIVVWTKPVDWGAYELVVCRSPWDYIDRVDEFCAWVRAVEQVTRLENPADVVVWNAHKSYMVDLAEAGVPVVPTRIVARGDGAGPVLAGYADDEVVVIKPAVSGGALDTERLAAGSPRAAAHLERLAAEGDVLVQPFQPQVHQGEISLVYFDGRFSHAVRKVPAAGEYRVHEYYGGTTRRHRPGTAELRVAEQVLAAAPTPTAYARIDLVAGPGSDGPLVMEAELIDPELFLRHEPKAAQRFAQVVSDRRSRPSTG